MNCEKCDLKEALEKMEKGDWRKLSRVLNRLTDDTATAMLDPCVASYVKKIIEAAKGYLVENRGKELLKLDGVNEIIETFSSYVEMGSFTKQLRAIQVDTRGELSIRPSRLSACIKGRKGAFKALSKNEVYAFLRAIADGEFSLENRRLSKEIIAQLIEQKYYTREQVLGAMSKADLYTAPGVAVIGIGAGPKASLLKLLMAMAEDGNI
jgi:hypothetical protein